MAKFDNDEFDFSKLDSLIKNLKTNKTTVKVGILGAKNARDDTVGNATIGAAHEFGTVDLPQRSFLRMPITEQLPKELEKAGVVTQKDIEGIIKENGIRNFAKKIGILAVATVLKAFDSGGFGTWKELSKATLAKKKVKQILVETHQLRDSITYEVVTKK